VLHRAASERNEKRGASSMRAGRMEEGGSTLLRCVWPMGEACAAGAPASSIIGLVTKGKLLTHTRCAGPMAASRSEWRLLARVLLQGCHTLSGHR